MSEQRNVSADFVGAMLVLAIIVLCVYISYSHSQVRDLQRRVGQLEESQQR